jgi:signal transduction histidine kinase
MWVNDSFFDNLPFPYFLIEINSGTIISKSQLAQEEFPNIPTFLELVEPSYLSLMEIAFKETHRDDIEISLLTLDNTFTSYRLFIYKDSELYIHLFLLPIVSPQKELDRIIDKLTLKFSNFQQEIRENKEYIDHTVSQIHEASATNQHNQNIEKLAAGIAHEIRNPLTTVGGFIQLLKPYLIEIGKGQYAEIALEELNRANQIIFEFLNASKPSENQQKPLSLNKLVKDTSLLYESEASLKNISIVNQFDRKDIKIIGNDKQLKQVLINLLKNAMEAIEERPEKDHKGRINYYTLTDGDIASIVIEDNGCGISERNLQNLFLPFYTSKETGTGIGLSVCKKIIEDHNGSIKVESTNGIGTIFRLEFPC